MGTPEAVMNATETEHVGRDKLVTDLKVVVADAEELLKATASQTGERITAAVRGQVSPPPPPGTPVPAYLGAVLAERNRREHARLMPPEGPADPAPVPALPVSPSLVPASGADGTGADGTGAAWKDLAWEREESGHGQPGQPADPPAPAAGGFVPPQ